MWYTLDNVYVLYAQCTLNVKNLFFSRPISDETEIAMDWNISDFMRLMIYFSVFASFNVTWSVGSTDERVFQFCVNRKWVPNSIWWLLNRLLYHQSLVFANTHIEFRILIKRGKNTLIRVQCQCGSWFKLILIENYDTFWRGPNSQSDIIN